MKFYLCRHCLADKGDPLDPTRTLTKTGEKQIPIIIDFLQSQTKKITAVIYSDMQRGVDTAVPIAEALDAKEIQTPEVGPDGDIKTAWKLILKWGKQNPEGELLIVSHGKFINRFTAWLLESGEGDKFHFSHGSVAHFDTDRPDGYGPYLGDAGQPAVFHWHVTTKLMVRFSEDDPKAVVEAAKRVLEAYDLMMKDTSREESEVIAAAQELVSAL